MALTQRRASAHMTRLPSVEVATTNAAGPARMWAIVSDIAVLPAFSAELQSVEWVGERRGSALGASFHGVNTHPAMGTWTTRSTIVAFDPPTQLAWAVGDPDNRAATWRFLLTGHHDVSQLRYRVVIGPGPSGVTMLIARDPTRRFRYRPPPQAVSRQHDSHSVRDQGAGRRQRPRRCVGTPRAAAVPVTGRRPNRLCRPFRVVGSTADRVAS